MDYEGTYEVIQHTRNNSGCETSGSGVDSGDKFFRLEERDGQLRYYTCTSTTECDEFANDTRSLDQREGDDWFKLVAAAEDGTDTCELQVVERRAQPAQNGIELTREKRNTLYQMPNFACTEDEARDKRDELECTEIETIIAVTAQ